MSFENMTTSGASFSDLDDLLALGSKAVNLPREGVQERLKSS